MKDIQPGIYAGLSNAEYHGGPGVSKSGLDKIRKSPAHFNEAMKKGYSEPTVSQRLGTLAHALLLEPETFWDIYALPFDAPEGALSTMDDMKARLKDLDQPVSGKKPDAVFLDDAKASYAEGVGAREVITAEEFEKVEGMRDAVMAHPKAGKLLAPGSGVAELSCYWRDPETGVLCRCRPDWWRNDGVVVDLKTARDASPEGFSKSINDWRYYVQDPFYTDGATAALEQGPQDVPAPEKPKAFAFVAVEPVKPYAVGVYYLEPQSRDIGRREYREDIARYAECLNADQWPAYSEKIEPIGLPGWRLAREEFNNDEEGVYVA